MTREQIAEKICWERIIWIVGIVNPFFMVPQLLKIWETNVTEGISVFTLVILFFIQTGFSAHGFFLRSSPLMLSNFAAAVVTFITVISTIYFRL